MKIHLEKIRKLVANQMKNPDEPKIQLAGQAQYDQPPKKTTKTHINQD